MRSMILSAVKMFLMLTVLTGVVYPLAVTGFAKIFFAEKAGGSLIQEAGMTLGSGLVAQKFTKAEYFYPRPSVVNYNPVPSGGSNLSPATERLQAEVKKIHAGEFLTVPEQSLFEMSEMFFSSASGIDPDISPMAALVQVTRVARARHLDEQKKNRLDQLVKAHTQGRQWGIFGEPRVNVLKLNLALDKAFSPAASIVNSKP